ncbi:3-oxoacyl-[acyl-carrier protein] reductase [Xaviernesmea oryzae]|uniref:3-oxoacyl-[acyl-carrier protein] reductase n=1 Tax=Xaviernesmea oryzae TaxID=464029 RepID=A0A1X7G206_9HYPH|nr:SDR family oxidoreductase [Xaviernesmea oryzae]SMF62524.1 3-oxoacyl-[acyl-carrier protein] reductase [Xaviernesmea oryzae]
MPSKHSGNAIVTGGARGIGLETVRLLARKGMRVGCLDIDRAAAEEAATQLKVDGLQVEPIVVDVTDRLRVQQSFDTFLSGQPLCAVINNAVFIRFQPFSELTDESLEKTLDVGLKGAIWCIQAALPALRRAAETFSDAAIVNVSSGAAFQGSVGFSAYSSLKAGLTGLTRQLAVELGRDGIRSNSVAPGPIPTESALADPGKPSDWTSGALKRTPLGRMGTPAEVAEVIAFLATRPSSWVNGQVISVDGGKSISSHDLR